MVRFSVVLVCLMVAGAQLSGCSSGDVSYRDQGAIGGAATGAGLGAIIGNQSGNAGGGALIGGGTGAVLGGLVGMGLDARERRLFEEDEMLIRQELEIERQRRELEDLRRQRFWDDRHREYRRARGADDGDPVDTEAVGPGFGVAPGDGRFSTREAFDAPSSLSSEAPANDRSDDFRF